MSCAVFDPGAAQVSRTFDKRRRKNSKKIHVYHVMGLDFEEERRDHTNSFLS